MKAEEADKEFLEFISKNGRSPEKLLLPELLSLMFGFFENVRCSDSLPLNNDDLGDALLFQYGAYKNKSRPDDDHYYIDLTRQLIIVEVDPDDGYKESVYFQLECTMTFDLTPDLELIEGSEKWCGSLHDLNEFKSSVLAHPSVSMVANQKPKELFISISQV